MGDTIFAFATPPGRSGVAVLRISGPQAREAAAALGAARLPARRAVLRRLCRPADGQPLDSALALRFDAPASFTGEDVVELHVHGGPAIRRGALAALSVLPGLRAAEAGEFTRRALENGRLDLGQVEGLGDLLAAETEAQARAALALMDGRLAALAAELGEGLLEARALVEAAIDFSDEDLPEGLLEEAAARLVPVVERLAAEIAGGAAAERVREGFEVALVGPPNSGKSSLLNMIAGRDAAIVSHLAGTTRDVIEVRLDLRGLPVTVLDMAGLREAEGLVEAQGVALARRRAEAADLRIFLVDGPEGLASLGVPVQAGDEVALTKADLRADATPEAVSGRTGAGVDALLERVAATLEARTVGAGLLGHERTQAAAERALAAVTAAQRHLAHGGPELAAAEIASAARALDALVGKVDIDAVLDRIFSSFCIGK